MFSEAKLSRPFRQCIEVKSPRDDTWGSQECVSQLENPTFRCWVIVAKLEIFNSKHCLCGWCSEPQLWLCLVSTAGCGSVRKPMRSMDVWKCTAGCSLPPGPLETRSRRPRSAAGTGRTEGASEEKGGSEAADFALCSLPQIPHPLPGVTPAPGSSQARVSTRLFRGADL